MTQSVTATIPSSTVPAAPLTPSELILLNGEAFASKSRFNSVQLLHGDESVSAEPLGLSILLAALLANEDAGAIRLEQRKKKVLFGLRTVQALYVVPGDAAPSWPAGTLESEVRPLAEELATQGKNEVANLVSRLLVTDTDNAWVQAVDRVKEGLGARKLADIVETKTLKIFTLRRYVATPQVMTLAARQPTELIRQMIARSEQERAELHKLLVKQIRTAINWRTKSDSSDNDFDHDFD